MKKARLLAILLSAGMTLLAVGCTSTRPVHEHGVTVNLAENQYEILGRVEYNGTWHNVLGIANWGGAAYSRLYEQAKKDLNADDVINVSIDYKTTAVGVFYNARTYVISGLAIKYKK